MGLSLMVAQRSRAETLARGNRGPWATGERSPGLFLEAPLGDVADAHDADRTLACHHGNGPEASFDHRLAGLLDRCVPGHRPRIRGHPLADSRLTRMHAPGHGAHEIALREDADHAAEVGDDARAHAEVSHLLGRLADRVRRLDREDVPGHDLSERRHAAEHKETPRYNPAPGGD